jgi:hypothetical protein
MEIQHVRLDSKHGAAMAAFDIEDLSTFERELLDSAADVLEGRSEASVVSDVIHEWAESGIAIQHGILTEKLFIEKPG